MQEKGRKDGGGRTELGGGPQGRGVGVFMGADLAYIFNVVRRAMLPGQVGYSGHALFRSQRIQLQEVWGRTLLLCRVRWWLWRSVASRFAKARQHGIFVRSGQLAAGWLSWR